MSDQELLVRHYLLYFVIPLWLMAGLTDYFLHKRTRIEENSGTKESLLHALQLIEAGIPIILALLFDINALLFAVMLSALVVHDATALWDVTYAHTRRYLSPLEQHVHSFLEVLPIMAVSFVTILYWNQFLALFGWGPEASRFEFRPKADPIPSGYLVALFSSIAIFIVLPYGEELWRCIKTARYRKNDRRSLTHAAGDPITEFWLR